MKVWGKIIISLTYRTSFSSEVLTLITPPAGELDHPDLLSSFMTRLHSLTLYKGCASASSVTFLPSFLSAWEALTFLPALPPSVMSPMRDLLGKISCLFLSGTITREQTLLLAL